MHITTINTAHRIKSARLTGVHRHWSDNNGAYRNLTSGICYPRILCCFCGAPKNESGVYFWHICLLLQHFSLFWVDSSRLDLSVGASSCHLLCHGWLKSLGGLLYSEGKGKNGSWVGGRMDWKEQREGKLWSVYKTWEKNLKEQLSKIMNE